MISNIAGYNTKEEWYIGKGSFASVYKAEKDGKFYAIKIFQTEYVKPEYKKLLDREIAALQKISHPNVIKLYASGTFVENMFEYFYIVMDLVEGKSLKEYVGSIDEQHALKFTESILETLDSIHKQGVLHRDLKPENIKINSQGIPIILDFGLSKLIDYSSIIQTGENVGTFQFMPPEQVTDSKHIDARADYFAVGMILYQLLTGKLPYDATNLPALIDQIKNKYPQLPSEINESITNRTENVILKLLEKEPYKRYQTVDEILNAFKENPKIEPKKLDLSTRFFIRLLHNEKALFSEASEKNLISNVIFPANFFKRFHPTVKIINDSKINFTTDPATNRLTYSAFSKTEGVQELPYSSGSQVTPIQKKDFHSISQVQEYVKKVIDYQAQYGINQLAAPFFYAQNINDEWFNINLKLIKETVDYRNEKYPTLPVWAGICMNIEDWYDEEIKNKILNSYVKTAPDGFFIYGDPVGNQSNLPQLFHYGDLLKKLQTFSNTPVVACRVNGFGLILLAFGISGISSGFASLDNFKESILSDTQDGYANDPRYYIPELLSLISFKKGIPTKLSDLAKSSIANEVLCKCPYCANIESLSLHNIKMHFLVRRNEELQELQKTAPAERLDYTEEKVAKAIEYEKILNKEGIKIANDFSHLSVWKGLIEEFKKIG